jgi:hypothetical protein
MKTIVEAIIRGRALTAACMRSAIYPWTTIGFGATLENETYSPAVQSGFLLSIIHRF